MTEIRGEEIFRIRFILEHEHARVMAQTERIHEPTYSNMFRFLTQIPVTCLILASCMSEKSPTQPVPAVQSEADSQDSRQEATSVLERAVLNLPPAAVADIPQAERAIFLAHLRRDGPSNKRLDVKNGFLEFYSDGEVPFHASSMLYMKVFPRKDGGNIVFCHMPKPQADTMPPRPGQTFFFVEHGGKWVDVTRKTLPEDIDVLWLFRHSRHSLVLQAGPYNVWKKPDGTNACGGDGLRLMDLVWDGTAFHARTAKTQKFDYDD